MTPMRQCDRANECSESVCRQVFQSINEAVFLGAITPDGLPGRFVEVNDEACRRLGYTRDELLQLSPVEIESGSSATRLKDGMSQLLASGGTVLRSEHLTKDGRRIPVEISSHLFLQGGAKLVLSIARDLTERQQMEAALQEAKERYRTLFAVFMENLPVTAFIKDEAGKTLFANKHLQELLGFGKWQDKSTVELIPGPTGVQMREDDRKALAEGRLVVEETVTDTQGATRIFETTKFPIRREGKPPLLGGIAVEITERKRTEAALRKSEHRWKVIFEYAPDAYYLHDLQGTVLEANHAAELLVGYRREEVVGKNLLQLNLLDAEGILQTSALLAQNALGRPSGPAEFRLRRKDNSWTVAEVRTYPIEVENQVLVLGIARDISARKQAESVLQASEQRYRQLFESVNDAIFLRAFDSRANGGKFIEVNDVACRQLGYSRQELLQKSPADIDPLVDLGTIQCRAEHLLSGQGLIFESIHVTKDGRQLPVEISSHAVDWDGERMVLSVARDLSQRRAAEAALRQSEENCRNIFEHAPVGVYQSAGRRFLSANLALATMFGYESPAEILASTSDLSSLYVDPTQRQRIVQAATQSVAYVSEEVHFRRKDGSTFIGQLKMRSVRKDPAEAGFLEGFIEDITERKLAETKLRESEEKFRQVADHIDQVFWISDKDLTKTLYVSPAYEKIWGRSCLSLYAQPLSFVSAVLAEDRARVLAVLEQASREGDHDMEYRVQRPDGQVRWIHDRGFGIRDQTGQLYRRVGLAEDVTNRRHLEEQLRQAQKMEGIGQLAGGVAHDFNNVIAASLMYVGLLQHRPQLPADLKEALKDIESELKRAANLTRQLLLFSRRQVATFENLDVNTLISDLLRMLRRLLGENIEIDLQSSSDLPCIKADAAMLEQVIMNLCVNARDAMSQGGKLTLQTALVIRDALSAKTQPDARPGRFVCLTVSDNGCGIPKEVMPRIFEPFFTTKEVGKGTGLGLATVYGIVKQHDGWLEVASEPGQGSSFKAFFPALPEAATPANIPQASELPTGGSETILLVEDEPSLRNSVALCLRKQGYSVFEAPNAAIALELWALHKQSIALLLTDQVMPGPMTGRELGLRLREQQPQLKVVLSSGYSDELAQLQSMPQDGFVFLAKPYAVTALTKLVRECLDRGKAL